MFNNLQGLALGIVTFAIIVGVGSIILYNFGGSVGCNNSLYPNFNTTSNTCVASNGSSGGAPAGTSYTTINYMTGNLGSSSGGLASWAPAIIAVSVGMLFLGAFLLKGRKN